MKSKQLHVTLNSSRMPKGCKTVKKETPTTSRILKNKKDDQKHENCEQGDAEQSPSKRSNNLHYRKVNRMRDDPAHCCIIQPGPTAPEGEYRRRRPYSKQHKNAWIVTLEKLKYVKCLFKNCYFIAMSLEDMISHFGYCNGDGSFAKYVCPHCKGRVTSQGILTRHIQQSHSLSSNYEIKCGDVGDTSEVKTNDHSEDGTNSVIGSMQGSANSPSSNGEDPNCNSPSAESSATRTLDLSPVSKSRKRKNELVESETKIANLNTEVEPSKKKMKNNSDMDSNEKLLDKVKDPKKQDRNSKSSKECLRSGTEKVSSASEWVLVQCGKCDFKGSRTAFSDHNLRTHVGLGWIMGETPVDLNDEKAVIKLVKTAFKVTKKATCEICQDVKRSFMGFVTHIQRCGKSEEEKDALKVQCPHCSAKCLKYSMPVHIKLFHSTASAAEEETKGTENKDSLPLLGKRRSALKAASKFQDSLSDIEEVEANYILFSKNRDNKFPKVPSRLNNIWYKLKREKKPIECRYSGCEHTSKDVKAARYHHFNCSILPEDVYMCQSCDFYSADESDMKTHMMNHKPKKRKLNVEVDFNSEGDEDDEVNLKDISDSDDEEEDAEDEEGLTMANGKKKRKKTLSIEKVKNENDYESTLRKKFCTRENLENNKRIPYFCSSLKMTMQDEWKEHEDQNPWLEFHTRQSDWRQVRVNSESDHLPPLKQSISFAVEGSGKLERKWRRLKRFEGDVMEGTPVFFTGGSVRCLSWCKISFHRTVKKNLLQYLALVTAMDLKVFRNIHEKFEPSIRSLVQVWNCGILENNPAEHAPKFCLGFRHKSEVWDLAWFPEDTSADGLNDRLPRLGLLATASEDGAVRIWSICDPSRLKSQNEPPIYETTPVAKLIIDEDLQDSCFRVAIGRGGILAGGYGNGTVALWNMKNIYSPFCEKEGKCFMIRSHLTIQAHRTSITALTFCPSNNRYILSTAFDRYIKLWDLESPVHPTDQQYKELCLNSIWTKNWPYIFYNFDDFQPHRCRGVGKFARDALYDRPVPCLVSETVCLNFTFSDWLNVLCGSTTSGDLLLRYLRNLLADQKRDKTTKPLSLCRLEKLHEDDSKIPTNGKVDKNNKDEEDHRPTSLNYEELVAQYGLVFWDSLFEERSKGKQKEHKDIQPDEFPIRAINVVSFNPNFKSFTHLAAGFRNGLVRIPCIREVQTDDNLKTLLNKDVRKLRDLALL